MRYRISSACACTLSSAVISLAAQASQASILYGPVVNPDNGHTYYLLNAAYWTDAEAQAVALGGHLATINNAAEDAFVYNTFSPYVVADNTPGNRSLIIGLNDVAVEGTFVWASGEPVTYTNWQPGQPNADRPDTDYTGIFVTFGTPGKWHDLLNNGDFNDTTYGVVEVVPEASSLALLAVGATLLHKRRK